MVRLSRAVLKWWRSMPDLLRLLAANCAIGIAVGWLLLTLLVATDVNGMGELIWNSSVPALPLGMLAAAFAITFGGAAMGSAVMLLGKDEPPQR